MRIALVLTVVLAVALAGCSVDEPPVLPQPVPSSTPIFASDEEALAAAEEAFARYLVVVDQIFADGGQGVERLEEVATDEVVAHETEAFESVKSLGYQGVGSRVFDSSRVQSFDTGGSSTLAVVTAYFCQDFSATDLLDANGVSVIRADRQERWPLVVVFDLDANKSLIVAEIEDWTGRDFCVAQ